MPKLILHPGQPEAVEIELPEGVHRVGRQASNDVQIDDASVSGSHCEIAVQGREVLVRDLNSTNGTFIDGMRITQQYLQPGQTLQVGTVRLLYPGAIGSSVPVQRAGHAPTPPTEALPPEPPPAMPVGAIVCAHHPDRPAKLICHHCQQLLCDACVALRRVGTQTLKFCAACGHPCEPLGARRLGPAAGSGDQSFLRRVPDAFKYPFKRDGVILLVGGALFLTFMGWLLGRVWLLGIFLLVSTYGYLAAYMQAIVATSAQGEEAMPRWPDLTNFIDDVLLPFVQAVGAVAVSFGPALAVLMGGGGPVLALLIGVVGAVFFPMAWLGVSMTESLAGLNPLVIIPSMLKVAGDYAVAVIVCLMVFGVGVAAEVLVPMLVTAVAIPLPGVLSVLAEFVFLYFMTVNMRILGLLYYCNRRRLGWF